MIFTGWDTMLRLLKMEVVQREYEGVIIPPTLKDQISGLEAGIHDNDESRIQPLYDELSALSPDSSFPYVQPNDLAGIRAQRPEGPRRLDLGLGESELLDKFHGAWTGRSVGCALGKPVEGMGMMGQKGMSGRKSIKCYLENRGQWPLDNYFSGSDAGDALVIACPQSWKENIQYMSRTMISITLSSV